MQNVLQAQLKLYFYKTSNTTLQEYYYLQVGDRTSNMLASERLLLYNKSERIKYSYDALGNIVEINENGKPTVFYAYDALNRLVREDNKKWGKTTTYEYDPAGNIMKKLEYEYSRHNLSELEPKKESNYGYDTTVMHGGTSDIDRVSKRDNLIYYNNEYCMYNNSGNPTIYRDKNLVWEKGRQLASYGDSVTFKYNATGVRLSKVVRDPITNVSSETKYYYDGAKLMGEETDGIKTYYTYGVDGIIGFRRGTSQYTYKKNALGDILGICENGNGEEIIKYVYDAYGNQKILVGDNGNYVDISNEMDYNIVGGMYGQYKELALANPFRYRGYYYDQETGLYYLMSRYYDPETGRFINADDISYLDPETVGGLNLYAYCGNNPVMNVDPNGHFFFTFLAILGTLFVGTLVGGVAGGITAAVNGQDFWAGFAGGAVSGFVSTVGMGIAVATGGWGGLAIAAGFGFASGFGGSIVQQGVELGWKNLTIDNYINAFISGGISMVINIATFGITNFIMRDTVGLFDNIFDKSLKFSVRVANSLSLSMPSLMATGMFSMPMTLANMVVDIIRYAANAYSGGYSSNKKMLSAIH